MIASQSTLHVDGREYALAGSKFDDLDQWESFVIAHRPDPFEALTQLPPGTSEEIRLSLARDAFNASMRPRFVTAEEGQAFDASLRGRTWALWKSLQQFHGEEFPTVADAGRLLAKLMQSGIVAAPESDAQSETSGHAPASAAETIEPAAT